MTYIIPLLLNKNKATLNHNSYSPCSFTEALEHSAVLSTKILLVKSMNSRILEREKGKQTHHVYCLDTAIYTSKENGFHEWYAFTQITDFRYGLSCTFCI